MQCYDYAQYHIACFSDHSTRICPVYQQNVIDGLAATSKRKTQTALWQLKQSLDDPSKSVKIVVFGGSETIGGQAGGCCHRDECYPQISMQVPTCAWAHYLGEWARKTYKANIVTYNLAMGGHTSVLMAEVFTSQFKNANITTLTSSDLVLLDHSINDRGMQTIYAPMLERGLELFIRELYFFSTPHSFPTIVLIELEPFSKYGGGSHHYTFSYKKIASHYNLPIWSYRDAVNSVFATSTQAHFLDYIRLVKNYAGGLIHPPWFLHLFFADMIAGMLLEEIAAVARLVTRCPAFSTPTAQ